MKYTILLVLFTALVLGYQVYAQGDVYLPQVADGRGGGLIIKTTFVLFNPNQEPAGIEIVLTDDAGNPLSLTIDGLGTDSVFAISLGPGETRFLESAADGSLKIGAARVDTSRAVGVSALFTIMNSAGGFLTEAGVGSALPLQRFVIPVDTTDRFDTGLALQNVALTDAQVVFRLRNEAGTAGPETERILEALAHQALYITELFEGLGQFRGTLEVESTRPLAAIVLRQNLSTFTSTTLPVTPFNSQQLEFHLPQVANGTYEGGSVRTSFILYNFSGSAALTEVTLTQKGGGAFPVSIIGGVQNSASFQVNLAPGASAFLQTTGAGTLTAGAARVTSNIPIGVASIFTLYDGQGKFQTEAGVGNSPALSSFTIPVDTRAAFDTGVAIFNPGSIDSHVTVRLLDENGTRLQQQQLSLPPGGHDALLVRSVFPGTNLPSSLSITATVPLSALTLRLNLSPLSYTTLPRAPQAFAGVTPNPALVKKILTGVSIDSALTLTTELPSGYGLKGAVKGDVGALVAVSAQDEEGNVYQASVDAQRRRYSVAVPAGVYSLKVVYKPALATFQGAPTLVFDASSPVSVQSDTNADIEIPKVAVFQVSGVVSGLSNQTGSAMVRFTGVEGRSGGEAFVSMDNSFSASLPSGSYVVSLAISLFGNYGRNRLAFYDIGRLTVSGADTQVNVELPAAFSVLGKVQITGMESIASESFVSVVDKAASFREAGTFLPDGWTSSLAISESGDYQGILPTGRELEVKVIVQLDGLEPSHLLFPVIARNITLSDNTRADFTLSAPPTLIPITGTVRSPEGSPVNDVVVSAFSESITAVDQAGALVSGRTNALGQFTLMVPAGSNYTITFSPPAP